MKTPFILLVITSLALSSCNMDVSFGQTTGNGNVITKEREVTEEFTEVRGSTGLDIFLEEGDKNTITVEADENLHEIITTEVTNGKLHVKATEGIGRAKAKKVYITYKKLERIEASSGADVIVNSVVKAENLSLKSSSGASLKAEIFSKNIQARSSSGSEILLSGQAKELEARASSGSSIQAKALFVEDAVAKASSGADISISVKERLQAKASSGGDIRYHGSPKEVSKDRSSSGSVRKG